MPKTQQKPVIKRNAKGQLQKGSKLYLLDSIKTPADLRAKLLKLTDNLLPLAMIANGEAFNGQVPTIAEQVKALEIIASKVLPSLRASETHTTTHVDPNSLQGLVDRAKALVEQGEGKQEVTQVT